MSEFGQFRTASKMLKYLEKLKLKKSMETSIYKQKLSLEVMSIAKTYDQSELRHNQSNPIEMVEKAFTQNRLRK
jgi:hypothetical protein